MIKWIRLISSCGWTFLRVNNHSIKVNRHKEKYPFLDRLNYARKGCQKLMKGGFRTKFIIKGEENITKGQKLYIGNHTSILDPLLFLGLNNDQVTFVAKKELVKVPFFNNITESVDCAFIDREDLRSEIKVFRKIDNMLEENKDLSILVYPEGTRSKEIDHPLLEFHPGTFKIATRRDIPIIPVVMHLTDRILNQQFHFKVYPIQVTYLKPLMPEEYNTMTNQQIASTLHERMNEELERMKANEKSLIMQFNHYSEKKAAKVMAYKEKKKK